MQDEPSASVTQNTYSRPVTNRVLFEPDREGGRKVCGETSRGESNNWLFQFLALRLTLDTPASATGIGMNEDIPRPRFQ